MRIFVSVALIAAMAGLLTGHGLLQPADVAAEEEETDGWTYEWDCDTNLLQTKHRVEDDGNDWAAGTHGEIPGDCDVHTPT